MIISAILNIVISITLAKPFGVVGVQIGSLISFVPIFYSRIRFVVGGFFMRFDIYYVIFGVTVLVETNVPVTVGVAVILGVGFMTRCCLRLCLGLSAQLAGIEPLSCLSAARLFCHNAVIPLMNAAVAVILGNRIVISFGSTILKAILYGIGNYIHFLGKSNRTGIEDSRRTVGYTRAGLIEGVID